MRHIRVRVVAAFTILLALVGSACSATADVTITPGLVEHAADTDSSTDLDSSGASADEAEPADAGQGAAVATTTSSSTTGATATTQVSDRDAALESERAEKAERRAAHDAFRRELYETLHGTEPKVELDHLPDRDILTSAGSGDTLRVVATVELLDHPDEPLVFSAQSNGELGVTHTIADRDAYARFLAARYDRGVTSGGDVPGNVESIAIINGGYTVWTRGLTPQIASTAYAPLDPTRWYVADAVSSAVRPFHGSTSELWERMDTEMPDGVFDADGNSTRSAEMPDPTRTIGLGFAAANPDRLPATLTTVTDANDDLVSIEVQFPNDDAVRRVRFELSGRGEPLDLPAIDDVLADPRDTNRIASDSYSWKATGISFEIDGDLEDSRWNVQGTYEDTYLGDVLTMAAGDAAALAGVTLTTTSPDHIIQRKGFEGTTYTVGMFPEILPAWAYPDVDPGAEYFNDIFGVPTHLFPMGLSEYDVWASLRTLPTIDDRRGWSHARITTGSVDPEFWNWRHREGEGFFTWILSEDPAERFDVTIGANADGRIERFELRTIDPDGSGLRFDITIDPVTQAPALVEVTSRPTSFTVDPAWSEAATAEEAAGAAPDIDEFFAASRAEHPTIDHARRPEHLTLLAERVKDEPSGAYTPDGEYYRWPSVYFEDRIIGSLGDTGQWIVCLELEDNEWRYDDNVFETFWRGYTDGSSLDGLTLRYNANAWVAVDVYASDGERHPADPCNLAASW